MCCRSCKNIINEKKIEGEALKPRINKKSQLGVQCKKELNTNIEEENIEADEPIRVHATTRKTQGTNASKDAFGPKRLEDSDSDSSEIMVVHKKDMKNAPSFVLLSSSKPFALRKVPSFDSVNSEESSINRAHQSSYLLNQKASSFLFVSIKSTVKVESNSPNNETPKSKNSKEL